MLGFQINKISRKIVGSWRSVVANESAEVIEESKQLVIFRIPQMVGISTKGMQYHVLFNSMELYTPLLFTGIFAIYCKRPIKVKGEIVKLGWGRKSKSINANTNACQEYRLSEGGGSWRSQNVNVDIQNIQ